MIAGLGFGFLLICLFLNSTVASLLVLGLVFVDLYVFHFSDTASYGHQFS